jgi:hypothetical protein
MISGILIRAIVVIVSAVFVVGSWITTGAPDTSLLSFFSVAVLACTILLVLWDGWAWKWKVSQTIPGVSRDLSGTWQAWLESFWIDPTTGTSPAPKTVYIVIRQTSSTATVTLISDESKSKSSLARVVKEDGSWLLHYVYTNEPRLAVRGRSPIHHGSAVLAVIGSPAKRLEGGYWTDRDSKGQLKLMKRSKMLAEDFEEAADALKKVR